MQLFVQHVGGKNVANIDDTVLSTRSIAEVRDRLPADAPEHPFFEPSGLLETRFPDGRFNCWGAVIKAKERQFDRMAVGDLFLIVPELTGERGGVRQLGILRAICREPAHAASAVLWPRAEEGKLYPYLFFFETEIGYLSWSVFQQEVGYKSGYNPRGNLFRLADGKLDRFGGVNGYLSHLRERGGFRPLQEDREQLDDEVSADGKRRLLAEIAIRQGQAAFRDRLLVAYECRCAISGCDVPEALEAAHVIPYGGPSTNRLDNGLLLRADVHTLFDLDLLGIDPKDSRVYLSEKLCGTQYEEFRGVIASLPVNVAERPDRGPLSEKLRRVINGAPAEETI